MNKKELEKMLYAVLRLCPAPLVFDGLTGLWKPLDVLYRVTGFLGAGSSRQMQVQTMSGALGYGLQLYFDSVIEFQHEDLHHRQFKQGRLVLKVQWVIPPPGQSPWSYPIQIASPFQSLLNSQRADH